MSGTNRESKRVRTDKIVLNRPEIQKIPTQEFIIDAGGNLRVPWMTPAATDLVLNIWNDISEEPFPVERVEGDIYCG